MVSATTVEAVTARRYVPCIYDEVAEQVRRYEATGGAEGLYFDGYPCVVLTSIGARTGFQRKVALIRVEADHAYCAIGSMGGQPEHPDWVHNLRANPNVRLQDGPNVFDLVAREVREEQRALWWGRACEVFPTYEEYQARTDRVIPVFVLDSAADT
jgi:deazaflavin-dependent oxidoreductase (nitroreductase family)